MSCVGQGAPEGVLERCTQLRLQDGSTVPLTDALRRSIQETNSQWGSGEVNTTAAARQRMPVCVCVSVCVCVCVPRRKVASHSAVVCVSG
jgi:hypothetical protein